MSLNVPALPLVRRLFGWLLLSGVTILASCGGGGGADSSTGGGGGGTAPTLTADYYPLNVGDTRAWRITQGSEMGRVRSERVAAFGAVGADQAYTVASFDLGPEYLARRATGVFSVPGPGSDAFTTALGPVEILRFGLAVGQTVVTLEKSFTVDADGDGLTDGFDVRIESTLVGFEPITTAAGAFPDAARVRTVIRSVVRPGIGSGGTIETTVDEWLAKGLGAVRTSSETLSLGVSNKEVEEVFAFGVGGRRTETTAPTLVSSTLQDGQATGSQLVARLNFSEAIDMASLLAQGAVQLINATGQDIEFSVYPGLNEREVTIVSAPALPEGPYEMRLGSLITDLAGNGFGAAKFGFRVDLSGPRLASSIPAMNEENASLSGPITLVYDEPVFEANGGPLRYLLTRLGVASPSSITLTGKISGSTVTLDLPSPLVKNSQYSLILTSDLIDSRGQSVDSGAKFLYFRTEPGPLSRPNPLLPGALILSMSQGDLNGDGLDDLVYVANTRDTTDYFVGAFFQQSSGGYAPARRLATLDGCNQVQGLVVAKAQRGGLAEIAMNGCGVYQNVTFVKQKSAGVFEVDTARFGGGVTFVVGALDAYGNGEPFFVIREPGNGQSSDTTRLTTIERGLNGQWQRVLAIQEDASFLKAFATADLNGDGAQDALWVRIGRDGIGEELVWAPRQGAAFGSSRPVDSQRPIGSIHDISIRVADMNQDGKLDIVRTHTVEVPVENDYAEIQVLSNDGAGLFTPLQPTNLNSGTPTLHAVADIDRDGRNDVLVLDGVSWLHVHLQGSDGSLQDQRVFDVGEGYYSSDGGLFVLDLNGDGMQDVIAGGAVLYGRPYTGTWPLSTNASRKQSQSVVPGRSPVKASAGRWRSAQQWRAPSP